MSAFNDTAFRYNSGYFDGRNSATFSNPIHNNWRRDHNQKVTHFDAAYLAGYIKGFIEVARYWPECFPVPTEG